MWPIDFKPELNCRTTGDKSVILNYISWNAFSVLSPIIFYILLFFLNLEGFSSCGVPQGSALSFLAFAFTHFFFSSYLFSFRFGIYQKKNKRKWIKNYNWNYIMHGPASYLCLCLFWFLAVVEDVAVWWFSQFETDEKWSGQTLLRQPSRNLIPPPISGKPPCADPSWETAASTTTQRVHPLWSTDGESECKNLENITSCSSLEHSGVC